jgi:hypothetical protein
MTAYRKRKRLASGLERAVDAAERPAPLLTSSLPVDRDAVEDARGELLTLALQLRSDEPVHDEGVAIAERLLTYGDSPLYADSPGGDLREFAHAAREAL